MIVAASMLAMAMAATVFMAPKAKGAAKAKAKCQAKAGPAPPNALQHADEGSFRMHISADMPLRAVAGWKKTQL